ncbi:hypothetical protein [Streptomyces sp. NPDC057580]|uniref:hypothetical protein n=1 Tax=Streptomyces sp. NPDC057580 TaxID=3346173 RepID=UPI0036BF31E9
MGLVFLALMAGEPTLARRTTTGVVPPLLDADRLRVYLLRCPPTDRDPIMRAYRDPLATTAGTSSFSAPLSRNI